VQLDTMDHKDGNLLIENPHSTPLLSYTYSSGQPSDHHMSIKLIFPADPGSCERRHHLPIWRSATLLSVPGTTASQAGSNLQPAKHARGGRTTATARRPAQNNPPQCLYISQSCFVLEIHNEIQIRCDALFLLKLW